MDLAEMLASAKEQGVKEGYNQALDDAIEFFMNHIHCNNNNPVVKDYVCKQLEKMKK